MARPTQVGCRTGCRLGHSHFPVGRLVHLSRLVRLAGRAGHHPLLPSLQECHASRAEDSVGTPIQVPHSPAALRVPYVCAIYSILFCLLIRCRELLDTDVTIPSEKVHEVADLVSVRLNASLIELRRLFLVEDLVDSVKFAVALWGLTYVGSMFNGLTLIIIGSDHFSFGQCAAGRFFLLKRSILLYACRCRRTLQPAQGVRGLPRADRPELEPG